ncbi:probable alpha,alpha-trehalose-phosphate synthase [UDP-forming] 8 [Olea europaea var. sylvestris]|nr:probable alpha,alpha-trehalose-phosphate synthase [UDP-forming] 8 [Olea europaea var. sylvestris]
MLSRSYFNLLNLDDYSSGGDRARVPRVISVPGIISDFDDRDEGVESDAPVHQERRVIVANQLPLKAYKDSETNKWCFDWDEDALILQMKDGFSPDVEFVYVGCLRVEIEPLEQEEVGQLLYEKFKCVPTFLSLNLMNKFYHGFCKHYLWPLFHYMLPFTPDHGVRFDKDMWQAYVSANKVFADKVMEVINPDEDYVWVHD